MVIDVCMDAPGGLSWAAVLRPAESLPFDCPREDVWQAIKEWEAFGIIDAPGRELKNSIALRT